MSTFKNDTGNFLIFFLQKLQKIFQYIIVHAIYDSQEISNKFLFGTLKIASNFKFYKWRTAVYS